MNITVYFINFYISKIFKSGVIEGLLSSRCPYNPRLTRNITSWIRGLRSLKKLPENKLFHATPPISSINMRVLNPVGIYLITVNNKSTRTRCEICHWRRSGVFIVNFEQILNLVLVFLLLTLNM